MNRYEEIIEMLRKRNSTIATMESCTGGGFANALTNIVGSSSVFHFGAVTYSNTYKIKMGVSKKIIDTYTVYSKETARAMAKAIADFSSATYGVGITGKLSIPNSGDHETSNQMVYISIYDQEKNTYIDQTLTVEALAREECKEHVLKLTSFMLLKMMKNK